MAKKTIQKLRSHDTAIDQIQSFARLSWRAINLLKRAKTYPAPRDKPANWSAHPATSSAGTSG